MNFFYERNAPLYMGSGLEKITALTVGLGSGGGGIANSGLFLHTSNFYIIFHRFFHIFHLFLHSSYLFLHILHVFKFSYAWAVRFEKFPAF